MRGKDRYIRIPEETYFLCMLHNIGAILPEKSLSIEEISMRTAIEPSKVKENLRKLVEANYIEVCVIGGTKKYHVSIDGIRKVLSMYS
ncbi:TPA: hypothetical protein EYP70_05415 [Candidatus Bathyarchaeota archaeon]|nr:hypothetical protein [Candidatus Bathyarchaeota archaeon]